MQYFTEKLIRGLYVIVLYVLTPVILFQLLRRGWQQRDYLVRWKERFGILPGHKLDNVIWVHAVSVGEVNAALPLIEALMQDYADCRMVVTSVTPTGSMRIQKLFSERVAHFYLPYDLNFAVFRFLNHVNPRIAVIMETEIWPNLFLACAARNIPIFMANARLSEKSLKGYNPVRPLARMAVRCVNHIAAQSQQDAMRFIRLGADATRISVSRNLKFDMPIAVDLQEKSTQLRLQWGKNRLVWIAASTHAGEELLAIQVHKQVLKQFPDALLLIAPRHPQRFESVVQLCMNQGLATQIRTIDTVANANSQCFVIDTLGELVLFYATCDVAFVGGSFTPIGGHNLLEPAALAKPVIVGPHTFNFVEIHAILQDAHAVIQVTGEAELTKKVIDLFNHETKRTALGQAGFAAVAQHRGATQRVMQVIAKVINTVG